MNLRAILAETTKHGDRFISFELAGYELVSPIDGSAIELPSLDDPVWDSPEEIEEMIRRAEMLQKEEGS